MHTIQFMWTLFCDIPPSPSATTRKNFLNNIPMDYITLGEVPSHRGANENIPNCGKTLWENFFQWWISKWYLSSVALLSFFSVACQKELCMFFFIKIIIFGGVAEWISLFKRPNDDWAFMDSNDIRDPEDCHRKCEHLGYGSSISRLEAYKCAKTCVINSRELDVVGCQGIPLKTWVLRDWPISTS